jgi:hypothetical protein
MHSKSISSRLGLMTALCLVHGSVLTSPIPARAGSPPSVSLSVPAKLPLGLPPGVTEMRGAILEAVQSGRLDDLKIAVDLNELKPELDATAVPDPIAFWRARSVDGTGADILAVLGLLLDSPFGIEPLGKDPENARLFVWPSFALKPLVALTPAEEALLQQLEPATKITAMKAAKRYDGWRVVIGADGVWHVFRRYD